jgi:hypothetical protein
MIRLALLYSFCALLAVYAWGDWYKSLCGLVLLIAVVEHPDMPKSMFGIQGLNPWNALLLIVVLAWARSRGEEGLSWDMPRHVTLLLLAYLAVVLWAFSRMMADPNPAFREAFPVGYLVSEYLVNCVKWVVPGLLLFDGCRSRSRFTLALLSLLGVYLLLGLQVVRWIPPGVAVSGEELTARSLKILMNEVGFHRVNLSMMLPARRGPASPRPPCSSRGSAGSVLRGLRRARLRTGADAGRVGVRELAAVGCSSPPPLEEDPPARPRGRPGDLRVRPGRIGAAGAGLFPGFPRFGPRPRRIGVRRRGRARHLHRHGGPQHRVALRGEKDPAVPGDRLRPPGHAPDGGGRDARGKLRGRVRHPHNAYLEMLLDNGLVGSSS